MLATLSLALGKSLFYFLIFSLLLLFFSDPVLALNVEKIGKGVVGSNREKMQLLSNISFYTGLFFVILGVIVTAFMKKKFALQKRSDTSNAMGPFLIGLGVVFMLLSLAF